MRKETQPRLVHRGIILGLRSVNPILWAPERPLECGVRGCRSVPGRKASLRIRSYNKDTLL